MIAIVTIFASVAAVIVYIAASSLGHTQDI